MAQKSPDQNYLSIQVIRTESVDGANTSDRVASALQDITDSNVAGALSITEVRSWTTPRNRTITANGKPFFWDPASTETDSLTDATNAIALSSQPTGRYIRTPLILNFPGGVSYTSLTESFASMTSDKHTLVNIGGNIVAHQIHKQLSDFGSPVYEPTSVGVPGSANINATWVANNAAIAAAAASGQHIEIPAGRYYVSQGFDFAIGTHFIGLGGMVEIVYGPAWSGTFYAQPLVRLDSVYDIGFERIYWRGIYHTAGVLKTTGMCINLVMDNTNFAESDGDHYCFDVGYVVSLLMNNCQIRDTLIGGKIGNLSGLSQFVRLYNFYNNSTYIGLSLENILIAEINGMATDNNALAYAGPKPSIGVTTVDDTRGILIRSSGGISIKDCHLERTGGYGYGIGIDANSSSTTLSGYVAVGWRLGTWGVSETTFKTGTIESIQIREFSRRGLPCHYLGSPTAGVSFDYTDMVVSSAAGTPTTLRYALNLQSGSYPAKLQTIIVTLNGSSGVGTAQLNIRYRDTVAHSWTTAATYTLVNGVNTISVGVNQRFSDYWDGWLGDDLIPGLGYALKRVWVVEVYIDHTSTVVVETPLVSGINSLEQPTPVLWDASPQIFIPAAGNINANVGSVTNSITQTDVTLTGWTDAGGTLNFNGTTSIEYVTTPAVSAWHFAAKMTLTGTAGEWLAVYGSHTDPSGGWGVGLTKIASVWHMIRAGGAINLGGYGADDAEHVWIWDYDGANMTVYYDSATIGPFAMSYLQGTELVLGSFSGGRGLGAIKSPILKNGNTTAALRTFYQACYALL